MQRSTELDRWAVLLVPVVGTTALEQTYALEATAGDGHALPHTFVFPDNTEDRLFDFSHDNG